MKFTFCGLVFLLILAISLFLVWILLLTNTVGENLFIFFYFSCCFVFLKLNF